MIATGDESAEVRSHGGSAELPTPLRIETKAGVSVPVVAVDLATAAKMLAVHENTVRREIDRGKLRAAKIGRVWRIRTAELDAYLKRQEIRKHNTSRKTS